MSKLASLVRPGRPHPVSPWIGVMAIALGACSGALTEYTSSVTPSRAFERPLIEARRCLETFGFDMKIIDVRAGFIAGEKFEFAHDRSRGLVVSEVSVLDGDDSLRIIARSRRASAASGGWEPVRVTERARRAVDRLAHRLDGSRSGEKAHCGPGLLHERDGITSRSRP